MSTLGVLAMLSSSVVDMTDRLRTRWHLRYHAPLDEDACEGDLVYVSGTVGALDETLVAPLTGRSCVAYRSRARGLAGVWQETTQLRAFTIERDDGEGTIVAFSEVADLRVPAQRLVPRDPVRIRSFLARHALANASVSEVLVELGARVYVGGTLVLVPHDAPPTGELGFRDPSPPDPHLAGNRDAPLVIMMRER